MLENRQINTNERFVPESICIKEDIPVKRGDLHVEKSIFVNFFLFLTFIIDSWTTFWAKIGSKELVFSTYLSVFPEKLLIN